MTALNDVLHVSLAKMLKDTPDLPVGTVEVDETVTLKVKATIKRSKDTKYTPTVAIPLKSCLALLLAKMGFQREHASKILIDAMTEALDGNKMGEETIVAYLADVDQAMERVQAITAALPKETRKGAMKVEGIIEVVDLNQQVVVNVF